VRLLLVYYGYVIRHLKLFIRVVNRILLFICLSLCGKCTAVSPPFYICVCTLCKRKTSLLHDDRDPATAHQLSGHEFFCLAREHRRVACDNGCCTNFQVDLPLRLGSSRATVATLYWQQVRKRSLATSLMSSSFASCAGSTACPQLGRRGLTHELLNHEKFFPFQFSPRESLSFPGCSPTDWNAD
jgi:hypothetical protein